MNLGLILFRPVSSISILKASFEYQLYNMHLHIVCFRYLIKYTSKQIKKKKTFWQHKFKLFLPNGLNGKKKYLYYVIFSNIPCVRNTLILCCNSSLFVCQFLLFCRWPFICLLFHNYLTSVIFVIVIIYFLFFICLFV